MNYSEDHIALAAEYALGTLDADERALVETMMIVDHGFMEVVDAWDRKLSPLHQMVAPIEPPPHLWDRISAALGLVGPQPEPESEVPSEPEPGPVLESEPDEVPRPSATTLADVLASAHPTSVTPIPLDHFDYSHIISRPTEDARTESVPEPVTSDQIAAHETAPPEQAAPDHADEIASPRASAATAPDMTVDPVAQPALAAVPAPGGRRGALVFGWAMTALAASLAGVVWLQAYRPELLPEPLRVKPKVQVVEVAAPPAPQPAQFVAVLQQSSAAPAFILTVDTASKNFTVRRIGATPQPGKSYELWLVSDKLQRPRSLGVIGASDFTIRPSLAAFDSDTINRATYAVTVEPEGGSPSGIATGPIVYAGTLVESVPALPAPR